ncbi:acetoin utilization protein AcuC [Nocardioides bruguierae]|uniref:Acetoin utilization protein AcuC n=1 Tax=Nocardioides bruguierae TaxID=2945102 RepID=A0A9X2D9N2_9ACTN|nr:acetoin utilization protein AcuC [Nocardioides bruguierae]MCM0621710.1 acetoin utilization protein AcuC [Nocardioides bruguierae]
MPECQTSAVAVFDDSLTRYNFGPGHPMSPLRVDLTMRLADELGLFSGPGALQRVDAPVADDDLVGTVHLVRLMNAVREAGHGGAGDERLGIGTEDNPIFDRMHEAGAHVVGATVEACRQVWQGDAGHAASIAGGLHHAMPDRISGFCVYNDVAVGIQWLLDHGAERVAYVDVDAHHGDGVERIFWDDPRVLTISLHETGQVLFPGTGFPADTGGRQAEGSAANVALPPGTGDAGWLRAFHAVVPPLLEEFRPDVLVSQHGCDSHVEDPLTHLSLSVDGQRAAHAAVHQLAHDHAGGRWVAVGGGGYELVGVVPRTWTHLLSEVAGRPLPSDLDVPTRWLDHVQQRLGLDGPKRMTDGGRTDYRPWSEGYDPEQWLDAAVHEARLAVFPLHGLDPMP